MMFSVEHLIPSLILVAALADDLLTRKVHNKLVLISLVAALAHTFMFSGWTGFALSAAGFGLALAIVLPFVLIGALGAGDMKILAAVGIAVGPTAIFNTFICSFVWGAAIGILSALFRGQLKQVAWNCISIATRSRAHSVIQDGTFGRIPYTAALLFGWLSHVVLLSTGGFAW